MEGRYVVLAADAVDERVSIGMTISNDRISIARYSSSGALLSGGLIFINDDQRVVELDLQPLGKRQEALHAVLKLHHSDWSLLCSPDKLVPILTLTKISNPKNPIAYYRLVRVPPANR
jgi:hypothetical protein